MEYPTQILLRSITLPLAHQDKRRAIYEINFGETGAMQYIIIADDADEDVILGNHYHSATEAEVFVIEEGGGMLYTRLVNEQGQPTAGQIDRRLKTGDRVLISRLMAHTFVMEPGSRMSCVRTRPWNQSEPDVLGYTLVG